MVDSFFGVQPIITCLRIKFFPLALVLVLLSLYSAIQPDPEEEVGKLWPELPFKEL